MDRINFQNNVTKLDKEMFDTFQNNIEKSSVVVSPTQPTTNEKVWFKKGKNKFDKSRYIENIGTGAEKKLNLKLEPNTVYTMSSNMSKTSNNTADLFFASGLNAAVSTDANGVWNGQSRTVTSDKNGYVTVAYRKQSSSQTPNLIDAWYQIEQGSKASAYEAYIEPTILVKNGSIFEEFVKKETIKNGTVINPDASLFSITRSNVVQIGNIVFVDLSVKLLAEVPVISQYQFKISGVKSTPRPIFPLASYGESDEFKANEIIYGSMINDTLYLANDKSKSLKNGFWKIHFSYPII